MRFLRVLLLTSVAVTILLLATKKISVHHWSVIASVGLFLFIGLLFIIKLTILGLGLEQRLERLATLRAARLEIEALEASVLSSQPAPVISAYPGGQTDLDAARYNAEEPTPDSRLARVLRDDYPL